MGILYSQASVGDKLPILQKRPTTIQLFRYSSVTCNIHRIHYDSNYAKEEGYPDVLVQSHLHGAFLTQLCTDWMGTEGVLKRFSVTVKRYATAGDTLTCHGIIKQKWITEGQLYFCIGLEERKQTEEICAEGNAIIVFPISGQEVMI